MYCQKMYVPKFWSIYTKFEVSWVIVFPDNYSESYDMEE